MAKLITLKGDWENRTLAQIQDQYLDLNDTDICTLKLIASVTVPIRDRFKSEMSRICTECNISMTIEEENSLLSSVYLYKFTHQKQVIMVLAKTLYNYFMQNGAI